jgi:hypothetical protein
VRERSSAEEQTAYPALRRLAGAVVVLLAISLPSLVAFSSIDAPLQAREIQRVERALFPQPESISAVTGLFYTATLSDAAIVGWPTQQSQITVRARFSGMLALFVISALVYLILAQVRGRATGVAGSLSLATMAPVAGSGFVLRPEQGATMFGLLGVALLVGLPVLLQRRPLPRLSLGGLMLVAGLMFGFAMSVHEQAWIYLALPALTLMLAVLALVFLFPRATRGLPLAYWPSKAAARRYTPWMLVVLVCSAMSLWVLMQAGGAADPSSIVSAAECRLFPQAWWWSAPLVGCAVVGGLRMGYGVSLRVQRLRRVRADSVLFLYVAALLMQHFLSAECRDPLPAAVAMACLLGDGLMTAVVVTLSRVRRG